MLSVTQIEKGINSAVAVYPVVVPADQGSNPWSNQKEKGPSPRFRLVEKLADSS